MEKTENYIDIEEEILMIRDGCNDCWLSGNCIISHAVDYIIERSEEDYEKMNTLISFWRDWCPRVELRGE